ncbi:phage repressor protein CI [Klebsiella pneumoniae]|uniref:phage repressor protein CI n=1 Tax=Klebsiella pneumoniae TaxID=573 RepID=UPI0004451A28|nr:phage repressor protein CI [Klebsiella pneumoniae]EWE18782.1 hypothetical protein P807_00914 [Klebsiella pneumoniae BIDMC 46b]
MDFNNGGREAILRMLEAYGVSTRKALCERLGISSSTMSTRWMRDVFPADWIIKCSIETDVPVEWLSFGTGSPKPPQKSLGIQSANENVLADLFSVPRKKIKDGKLLDSNFYLLDKALVPDSLQKPIVIMDSDQLYLVDQHFHEVTDGKWVVEIEGKVSIRELTRIPVGRVKVGAPNPCHSFECFISELNPIARCHFYLLVNLN